MKLSNDADSKGADQRGDSAHSYPGDDVSFLKADVDTREAPRNILQGGATTTAAPADEGDGLTVWEKHRATFISILVVTVFVVLVGGALLAYRLYRRRRRHPDNATEALALTDRAGDHEPRGASATTAHRTGLRSVFYRGLWAAARQAMAPRGPVFENDPDDPNAESAVSLPGSMRKRKARLSNQEKRSLDRRRDSKEGGGVEGAEGGETEEVKDEEEGGKGGEAAVGLARGARGAGAYSQLQTNAEMVAGGEAGQRGKRDRHGDAAEEEDVVDPNVKREVVKAGDNGVQAPDRPSRRRTLPGDDDDVDAGEEADYEFDDYDFDMDDVDGLHPSPLAHGQASARPAPGQRRRRHPAGNGGGPSGQAAGSQAPPASVAPPGRVREEGGIFSRLRSAARLVFGDEAARGNSANNAPPPSSPEARRAPERRTPRKSSDPRETVSPGNSSRGGRGGGGSRPRVDRSLQQGAGDAGRGERRYIVGRNARGQRAGGRDAGGRDHGAQGNSTSEDERNQGYSTFL